jgi:hypothetical protein
MLGARDRSLAGRKSSLLFDQVCNCVHATVQDGHGGDEGKDQGSGTRAGRRQQGGGKGNTRDDKREEVRSKYDDDDDADQHGKEK